ncbi:SpoIIE family protein phosphatase [Streptomyces minutiscleroticus]|uniref:protein-serine/threonine phosphatase n=1 Tax=Streptomyces minutiscleroticus TaxID=68238 RepID=A0A918U3J0_9ACTN|nr:SpoIIE family protein phosphatase [Streptomyces minutiscleroticus]GGX88025.1 hypothetical protein GCM10010358_47590 [Streptomyces minutiscleroticus]
MSSPKDTYGPASDVPFDEAATARAVVDADGTLVAWNEGARRLLGHAPAEVVGRPAARLLVDGAEDPPPDDTGNRRSGTLTLRHRDGRTTTVWVLAHRLRPELGDRSDWLVVSPLEADRPRPADDPLATALIDQSPCALAIFDERLRLHRVNGVMADTVGLPAARIRGLRLPEVVGDPRYADLEQRMARVLARGQHEDVRTRPRPDRAEHAGTWLVRLAPLTDGEDKVRGVCVAVHDVSDQFRAEERLRLVNEASVRIGSTLDVTCTAQELADVLVPALADFVSVDLLDPLEGGGDPDTEHLSAPVALRRVAHRSMHPGAPEAVVEPGRADVYPESSPQADSLLTGRTVVIDDLTGRRTHWPADDPARAEYVTKYDLRSVMSVPLRARGATLGVAVLTRSGQRGPFSGEDVLLAEEVAARAAVCVDNARRYSRERDTALALQRSLLPRRLPRTAALEAASRYLPAARAGVGGDWFDVIPLSGLRVALVVGDVVGHGVQASATMGRLRTAVRTLADIDLAPDELLTHLDDLVVRLSADAGSGVTAGEVGASCLYAVYDPVSRRCTMARAGHPAPVLVAPGAAPRLLDLPAGPALGLSGLPFESVEIELREDSVLAFYTDGLLESPGDGDADTGHRLLCEALARRTDSLEDACREILHSVLPPGGAADDVALLLARTHGLPASAVATWDIPADPALVAPIRKQVVDRLERWGLAEEAFTTELVVSELVTNAIRYGERPIRLRLIHDDAVLICEVSDSSHTAPHLRRARTYDEGGRGLLLVAQLTRRWGSRHTPEGKTIWAEMPVGGVFGDGPADDGA